MTVKLKISDLSFSIGKTKILHDINLTVKEGTFFGIVGPNGSGKTTLLRLIVGMYKPEKGQIELFNKGRFTKFTPKNYSLMTQNNYSNYLSVEENIEMGRYPWYNFFGKSSSDSKKIAMAIQYFDIESKKERCFNSLSGGEQRRVRAARMYSHGCQLLLLDEPTSNLDWGYKHRIVNLFKQLCKDRNNTVVATLHDLEIANQYCDELALVQEGRVLVVGKPHEVLSKENIEKMFGLKFASHPLNGQTSNLQNIQPQITGVEN